MFALLSMGAYSQVSWNVKGGMNISNWSADYALNQSSDSKVGYKVGVGMEYGLNKMWSIQPSLLLSSKGMKVTQNPLTRANYLITDFSLTVNQMYLEMPINAQVRIPLCNYSNIVIAAGPYFAYGIGGKSTTKLTFENGSTVETKGDTFGTGDNDANLKKFDMGLGAGVAFEMGHLSLGIESQFGFTKLMNSSDNQTSSPKNINYSLILGYRF